MLTFSTVKRMRYTQKKQTTKEVEVWLQFTIQAQSILDSRIKNGTHLNPLTDTNSVFIPAFHKWNGNFKFNILWKVQQTIKAGMWKIRQHCQFMCADEGKIIFRPHSGCIYCVLTAIIHSLPTLRRGNMRNGTETILPTVTSVNNS